MKDFGIAKKMEEKLLVLLQWKEIKTANKLLLQSAETLFKIYILLLEAPTLSNGNRKKHLSAPAAGTALDVLQLSGSYKKIEQKSMAYILQKEIKRK